LHGRLPVTPPTCRRRRGGQGHPRAGRQRHPPASANAPARARAGAPRAGPARTQGGRRGAAMPTPPVPGGALMARHRPPAGDLSAARHAAFRGRRGSAARETRATKGMPN